MFQFRKLVVTEVNFTTFNPALEKRNKGVYLVTRPLNWSINSMTSSIYRDKVRHTLIFDHWSWNTLKLRFVQGERMWSTDSFNGPKFESLCLNFKKDILWRHRIYIELLLNKVAVTDNGFSTVNLFGHLKYSKRSRLTWSSRFLSYFRICFDLCFERTTKYQPFSHWPSFYEFQESILF